MQVIKWDMSNTFLLYCNLIQYDTIAFYFLKNYRIKDRSIGLSHIGVRPVKQKYQSYGKLI